MSTARRLFPFLGWWPFQRETLKADLIAGFTVALLAIPQSMAYAQLAGVPIQYGLYAALIPTLIGAMFGSSGVLSTGPVAMTSLLTAASISQFVPHGEAQYLQYAMLLALVSGLFQVAFGMMRLGVLVNFVSHPVLKGLINAAAIIIGVSQLPEILGIPVAKSQHFLIDTWRVVSHIDSMHAMSLAFGLTALILLLGFRRLAPRWPGVLITVALLTAASYLLGYEKAGGHVVGAIPQSLPGFSVPTLDWNSTINLLPAGFVIALISFMEAMSSCKVIAFRTRTPWNENQELIGQGMAKIAAAFTQSIPVSGSFSRSALNLVSGAKTGMSSVFAAGFVLLALLLFTPLLHYLPKPVLAAIIIIAVLNLFDFKSIVKAWRARTDDGVAAMITFIVTLALAPNIQIGILTGIVLSLALLLYRLMRPRIAVLGLHEDGTLRDAKRLNLPELHPELGAMRFDGSLIFVNVSYFEDAVLGLHRENRHLKFILVAAGGINMIDASGVEALSRLVEHLRGNGVILAFSGIKQQVLMVMGDTGLTEEIGPENIYPTDIIGVNGLRVRLESAERPG